MSDAQPDDLLTAAEAAAEFRISQRKLEGYERLQRLRVVRVPGRGRRYRRSDVARVLEEDRAREEEERLAAIPPPPPPPPRPTRSGARRRALEMLHAADVRHADPRTEIADDAPPYTRTLVDGVAEHAPAIDALISQASERWTVERMPVVDRNVLRLAIYELLHTDEPTGVIVHEAVGLAKLLSTEESGRFVNGVLSRIAREQR